LLSGETVQTSEWNIPLFRGLGSVENENLVHCGVPERVVAQVSDFPLCTKRCTISGSEKSACVVPDNALSFCDPENVVWHCDAILIVSPVMDFQYR